MSEPKKAALRLVTTDELATLYPSILPRTTLDFYARKDPRPIPYAQPGGKGSRRVYNLDLVEEILVSGLLPPPPDQVQQSKKLETLPLKLTKRRGRIGTGLASYVPKKRGPKPASRKGDE